MSPYELVRERYALPFDLREYQFDEVNTLAEQPRVGFYWEPGAGKTAGSTVWALYWLLKANIDRWCILVPPILLYQWQRWLESITDLHTGKPLAAQIYYGDPRRRAQTPLNSTFTLTSYATFKNDFDRLEEAWSGARLGGLCDEATAIKNIETDNHKAVRMLFENRHLGLLTGTPINKPVDAYAYIRLVAPGTYRNQRQFNKLHVAEYDEYENPKSWANLDLLADNMKINTSRILIRDVSDHLPPVIYTPIHYELDAAHLKLYKRIADERLVEFENGKTVDAISASAVRSALQQVVINWGEFDENPDRVPKILELIEETLEELGDRKLAVAAHFQRTNRYLLRALAHHNAVAIYGETSPKGRQESLRRFKEDPSCRVILLQPSSAGFGVDGLQHVCSDLLVVEAPSTPTPFEQVVKRFERDGAKHTVNVRIAIAKGTVQVGMFRDLLHKDEVAGQVQGSYKSLKEWVNGA
jgi:SNF2 family DNA or RNA helicase